MRTLIFVLFFAFVSNLTQAQDLNFSTEQHISAVVSKNAYVGYEVKFAPKEARDIVFKWKRLEHSIPSAWTTSLCDYGGCYVGLPPSGTMSPLSKADIENGEEAFFILNINLRSYAEGTFKVYVYDANNYDFGDTVTFKIVNKEVLSMPTIAKEIDFNVSPNPASDQVTISTTNNNPLTVTITDLRGVEVLNLGNDFFNKTKQIDVSGLRSGMYIVFARNKGNLVASQRLIIQ